MEGGEYMRPGRTVRIILLVFVLMAALMPLAQPAAAQSDTVYYIPVKGEINPAMASFISGELDTAYQEEASAVVLEISTLGGRVDSALDISEKLYPRVCPLWPI